MKHFVVRAQWGEDDRSNDFIESGKWINGKAPQFENTVNSIELGDVLFLAGRDFTVINTGHCIANPQDGTEVVVAWDEDFKQVANVEELRRYVSTVNTIKKHEIAQKISEQIALVNPQFNTPVPIAIEEIADKLKAIAEESKRHKLFSISLENFKFFKEKQTLDFEGKNILLYGENGSGKSSIHQALKLLSISSVDKDVFDRLPSYKNIFANSDDDVMSIELKITNKEAPIFFNETTDYGVIKDNSILNNWGYSSPFLEYKDVLQIYIKDIVKDDSRNLFRFFETVLADFVITREADTVTRLADLTGQAYFDKLVSLIDDMRDQFNEYLKIFNAGIKVEGYNTSAFDKEITLQLSYQDVDIPDYQTFFNEARLTALGLSIYFTVIGDKFRQNPSIDDCRILVLDDLLLSLDMSHRMELLNVIDHGEFKLSQKLLFTHDRSFYNVAKDKFAKTGDWKFIEMFEDDGEPLIIESRSYLQKAKAHMKSCDYEEAANNLRKTVEELCQNYIKRSYSEKTRAGKFKSLQNMLDDLGSKFSNKEDEGHLTVRQIIEDLKSYKNSIMNPFSHCDKEHPLYRKELSECMSIVEKFKEKLESR